jgi:hypothetical protein
MEKVNFPSSLISLDSEINIYFEENLHPNRTKSSVVIEGNRSGFLSLSHLINVYNVYLYDPIKLSEFSFVHSAFCFCIKQDEKVLVSTGIVVKENKGEFKWMISETNLFVVTGLLHSLGYANDELHLDEALHTNEISVYCLVK